MSESSTEGSSESTSRVPMLIPEFGKELSHIQFRSLEEQKFRAMAALFDQQERRAVARLVGISTPVSLRTPDVPAMPGSSARTERFLTDTYKKISFALTGDDARKQLAARGEGLAKELLSDFASEPATAKRKLR